MRKAVIFLAAALLASGAIAANSPKDAKPGKPNTLRASSRIAIERAKSSWSGSMAKIPPPGSRLRKDST